MVPMMVPVPPIFIRVTVVAVAFAAVVVRSVLVVSGVNKDAEPIVCFGFGSSYGHQPEGRQTQEEISFHNWFSCLDGMESHFMLLLASDQAFP
jgi:hypothetical protein